MAEHRDRDDLVYQKATESIYKAHYRIRKTKKRKKMRILDEKNFHDQKIEVAELDDKSIVLLIDGEQTEVLSEIRKPAILRSSFVAKSKLANCPCEQCKWLVENEAGSIGIRSERLSSDGLPQKSFNAVVYAASGGGVEICGNLDSPNPIWRKVATV